MKLRSHRRKGVLLLVVLSLLVLFVLIGMTFLIAASQFRKAAAQAGRVERSGGSPAALMDLAIHQMLVGTAGGEGIGYHSLLEDLYGRDGFGGVIATSVSGENGTALVQVRGLQQVDFGMYSRQAEYYSGGVATVTSQTGQVQSGRVLRYSFDNAANAATIAIAGIANVQVGDRLLVNGNPFNGVGAGFDSTNPTMPMDLEASGLKTAFLSNYPVYRNVVTPYDLLNGGWDESWDVADYQNLFLGWQPADVTIEAASRLKIIPSFHRPSVAAFHINQALQLSGVSITVDELFAPSLIDTAQYTQIENALVANKARLEAAIMRPLRLSNPSFGTPLTTDPITNVLGFNPVAGPWDIDNDGDGIAESVWIDSGLPVQQSENGQLYKSLFAIHCVDLDGRFNVNAHGSLAAANQLSSTAVDKLFPKPQLAGSSPPVEVYGGSGYGPADVDLGMACLYESTPGTLEYDHANYQSILRLRYEPVAGGTAPFQPGAETITESASHDYTTNLSRFGTDLAGTSTASLGLINGYLANRSSFMSPPNFHGHGAIAIDHAGQPLFARFHLDDASFSSLANNPYESNLLNPNRFDSLFSADDLEGVMRFDDLDSSLSPRLSSMPWMDGAEGVDAVNRKLITTHSFDVSAPKVPGSVLDLFGGVAANNISEIAPREFFHGAKMNLNRLFGDGIDNNNNGVVDEFDELASNTTLGNRLLNDMGVDMQTGTAFTTPLPNSQTLRQLYARHLYCTLMAILPPAASGNGLRPDMRTETQLKRARIAAQWAVNAVDFRDADSIMTRFEYDPNPLNGSWAPGPANVVWGCERPELLITETFATHDRRTEDGEDEIASDGGTTGMVGAGDTDRDQRLRPIGSLFVELYNPWLSTRAQPNNQHSFEKAPAEFYDARGVDLDRVTPSEAGPSSPIWRLLIVGGDSVGVDNSVGSDPDEHPDEGALYDPGNVMAPAIGFAEADVERIVYFCKTSDATAGLPNTFGAMVFHPSLQMSGFASIAPGRYAVIGPGTSRVDNGTAFHLGGSPPTGFMTTFGRLTGKAWNDAPEYNLTSRIEMYPGVNNTQQQVRVIRDGTAASNDPLPTPAVAVVIDRPQRLSVSEPVTDYLHADFGNPVQTVDAATGEAIFNTGGTLDVPLDSMRADLDLGNRWPDNFLMDSRIYRHFRMVALQRLANPLKPWNALTNPYRTIDTQTVDLHSFNGFDDADNPDFATHDFSSLERGRWDRFNTGTVTRDLWSHERPRSDLPLASIPLVPTHELKVQANHSLGRMNDAYGDYYGTASTQLGSVPSAYLGQPFNNAPPFPWLTWNNRPYANHFELMMVPTTSSSRLLHYFSTNADPTSSLYNRAPQVGKKAPFAHLMGFFGPARNNLLRLFDYVEVPSRFAGSQMEFEQAFTNPAIGRSLQFPFSSGVSNRRDPGLININSINSYLTWNALVGLDQASQATQNSENSSTPWDDVQKTLRLPSYDPALPTSHIDVSRPTQFLNPYRTATATQFVPSTLYVSGLAPMVESSTLLRRSGTNQDEPMHASGITSFHADASRSAYMAFSPIMKQGNVTTTTSSVFAVWVTVGDFEVTYDAAGNPQLGQELGSDTGSIERHRAFYIIDRSIPVAFEPGVKNNVDDAIILRRVIE